ncbi:MAG: CPBP family intramembrane metalloprotease [Acetatifactor sp.]|nr:CPBP family intramembrane metalloprotease [Acetatifactor sp.]
MEARNTTKKQFIIYMIMAFGLGWIVEIIASTVAVNYFQYIMMAGMFVPFLSVLIARIPLKGMGWVPHLKGKIRFIFFALYVPVLLSLLGGGLFFLIFPNTYDPEFTIIKENLEATGALALLEAQGMTLKAYMISSIIQSVTWAPFFNMFLALGEEVGWRGAMYPYLKEKLGVTKGRIVGGVLWGAWHWPLMILAGYEYGKEYFGAPVLGPVVFCVSAAALGILIDYVYDKTKCIWLPALMHGSVNAFTIFLYMLKVENYDMVIFGPAYIGMISVIPMLLLAIILSLKAEKSNRGESE